LKAILSCIVVAGLLGGGASAGLAQQARDEAAGAAAKPKAVVELFTSQGCSSCPPADALLGKLAKRDDMIALTFPVDYWDYLGWKDTLASPAHTWRQRQYAKVRGDGQIYTPQVVVNGLQHVNGSKESEIEAAVRKTAAAIAKHGVAIKAWGEGDAVIVEAGGGAPAKDSGKEMKGTLHLALISRRVEVAIARGENKGHKVAYTNVVRQLKPIGDWAGAPLRVKLPKAEMRVSGADYCAVLLQQGIGGPILAAVEIKE
jgi:hypothetical protein